MVQDIEPGEQAPYGYEFGEDSKAFLQLCPDTTPELRANKSVISSTLYQRIENEH